MAFGLLFGVCLLGTPAPQAPERAALEVRLNVPDGRFIRPDEGIGLQLSRALVTSDERLGVVIADTDWTGLFTLDGQTFGYRSGPARLPSGESAMVVYLVSATNEWRQVAAMTIRVTTPAGFEHAEFGPKLDMTNTGQVAETHRPAADAPPRHTFQDFGLSLGLRSQHVRSGLTIKTQTNLLGVTNQPQALRFPVQGKAAPRFDLADYLWSTEGAWGRATLGHMAFSSERHLLANFASRGLSFTSRLSGVDITVAALSGNAIVGFTNFFGLGSHANQVNLITVGTEILKSRPGGAHVEATVVDGARLPRSSVNQGQVNDAERSRGVGLRFVGTDKANRLRLDSGFARSRFSNPADPLLSQDLALVPIKERTNNAEYLDLSYDMLKGARVGKATPVNLVGSYRFERVDPLFRSVGIPQALRSDVLQHVADLSGGFGPLVAQVSETWSHDNLGHVASLLRTNTGVTAVSVTAPLAALAAHPTAWLPAISYQRSRSTQIGQGQPANGGFVSASQIPNQANTAQTFRSEWAQPHWRASYSVNHSLQDNRQQGRELSDFINLVELVSIGVTPSQAFDVSTDIDVERATNKELSQVGHTRRVGVTATWRVTTRTTLNGLVSRTSLIDPATSRKGVTDLTLQYTRAFTGPHRGAAHPQMQVFARTTWQSADVINLLFGGNEQHRKWSLSTGLTLAVF